MINDEELNSPAFDGWPVPNDLLIELGRLLTLWGALEAGLNVAIGKLSGYDHVDDVRPLILLTHASFPQRLDNLSSLCHQLEGEFSHLSTYKEVVAEIRKAQSARNKFAHNMIVFDEELGDYVVQTLSARGKLTLTTERISISDIRRASAQTHMALLKLHALVTKATYPPIWRRLG